MKITTVIILFLVSIAASQEEPDNPTRKSNKVVDTAVNAYEYYKNWIKSFFGKQEQQTTAPTKSSKTKRRTRRTRRTKAKKITTTTRRGYEYDDNFYVDYPIDYPTTYILIPDAYRTVS